MSFKCMTMPSAEFSALSYSKDVVPMHVKNWLFFIVLPSKRRECPQIGETSRSGAGTQRWRQKNLKPEI